MYYLSAGSGFSSFSISGTGTMLDDNPTNWVVIGAMDADGNGHPDLFFKNNSSGEVTVNYYGGSNGLTWLSWDDVEQVQTQKILFVTARPKATGPNSVLLYIGSTLPYTGDETRCDGLTAGGVSDHDYYALERELDALELGYDTATMDGSGGTLDLINMTQSELDAYKLFIVPGGDVYCIAVNWPEATRQMVQSAVLNSGVSYLGICAGAFVAGDSDPYLNLTGLPLSPNGWNSFDFYSLYYSLYNPNTDPEPKAIVQLSLPSTSPFGTQMNVFWFSGPQLSGFGSVLANYPDGTPAAAEEAVSDQGFIVLSGVHSEAPASWFYNEYGLSWTTSPPIQTDFAFAASLINSALTKTTLPLF